MTKQEIVKELNELANVLDARGMENAGDLCTEGAKLINSLQDQLTKAKSDLDYANGKLQGMTEGAELLKSQLAESPITHCKDCIYMKDAKVNCKGFLICPASRMEITNDDYCSYAERKAST